MSRFLRPVLCLWLSLLGVSLLLTACGGTFMLKTKS